MLNVGPAIRYYRIKQGMTQAELAVKLGWKLKKPKSTGPLSAYEKGDAGYKPSLRMLQNFAQALGCRVSDLVSELPADAPSILAQTGVYQCGPRVKAKK